MFARILLSRCVFFMLLWTAFGLVAYSQFLQEGSKLVGTGSVGGGKQGYSVSLSADGSTALVGGYADNGNIGAAWVYLKNGGVWTQQGAKLVGSDRVGQSNQGYSVAISADGNTAIVGGLGDNGFAGAAWVYTRTGGVWTQQGTKLVGTGAVGNAYQGYAVAISSDGNTALVGGYFDNSYAGAVWVFTRTAGVWTQQGTKIVGTGATSTSVQGSSVSLSADGNTALVGGRGDNSNTGATWVFTRTAGVWNQQGSKLVGTGAVGAPYQGYAVSLSADGNTALIGGYFDNFGVGATWVFIRNVGVWTQQGNKLVGATAPAASNQGWSVSLSADGNTAIQGGWRDNLQTGAAWVFTRSGGVWTQQGDKLVGTGGAGVTWQGAAVCLSADGNTALIGGDGDNTAVGATWIFSWHGEGSVVSVQDIPEDQGGKVRIRWNRSYLDDILGYPQVISYGIWRRVPPGTSPKPGRVHSPFGILNDTLGSNYDYVATVPAVGSATYNYVASTLADSLATGTNDQTFVVSAHTADISRFWVSKSMSGHSIDNLAPLVPGNFGASLAGAAVNLQWNPTGDQDVARYEVYASTISGFVPGNGSKLGDVYQTSFSDAAPASGAVNYFRVRAIDVHGNMGALSTEASIGVPVSRSYVVNPKWNMVSVPLDVADYHKLVLFAGALGDAFGYANGYSAQPVLQHGAGYWIKYPAEQIVSMSGLYRLADTISVVQGWNLIGSIGFAVASPSITSPQPGMSLSTPFGYTNGYQTADTIRPGRGYWIKANTAGQIILTAPGSSISPRAYKVSINTSADIPPAPPAEVTESLTNIPTVYSLDQNYPNPFNPTTTIHFALPVSSVVTIRVFNMLGQSVATLAESTLLDAGEREVRFDASSLSSGLYTYRLEATSVDNAAVKFTQVRKMILLK